jgi:hypothetical protein
LTGTRLWEMKADWGAVAGDGRDAVVVVGQLLAKGYEVLDPMTGAVRRRDSAAVAVWTFRNALLDARCAGAQDCTLTAWDPHGGPPLWTVDLPGIGFVLFADNPELLGSRTLTTPAVNEDAGGPRPMPQLLGFPIDGRVHVVDTTAGRVVREIEPDRSDRVVVVGGRVLHLQARAQDGACYFTVLAKDAVTDQEVWRRDGFNLRTIEGGGCVQRRSPAGRDNVIVGVAPDGREAILDAYDGRVVWTAGVGQKMLALDDSHALVRARDGKSVLAFELGRDGVRWSRPAKPGAQAALTRYAAIVVGRDPARVFALDRQTGRVLLDLHTEARVLAVGPEGLVLGEGREIAYVSFAGAASTPAGQPSPAEATQAAEPPGGRGGRPPCADGPKDPGCERGGGS